MININDIGELFSTNGDTHIRIYDSTGKHGLMDLEAMDPASLLSQFSSRIQTLSGYKKLVIKAGTEKSKNANFTNARCYIVFFPENSSSQPDTQQPQQMGNMGVYNELFATKLTLELLKQENSFSERLRKLEEKTKDGMGEVMGYLPIIGKAMGWEKDEIKEMMQLSLMGKGMQLSGPDPASSGSTKLSVHGTEDEKIAQLEILMAKAAKDPAIGIDKIIFLLDAMVKNPPLVEQAITYIQFQNSK